MTHHEPTELQSKRLDRLADRIKQLPQHRQERLMTELAEQYVFTVENIADVLDVTTESVRRWIRQGDLHAAKVGRGYRVSRRALNDFWQQRGGKKLFADPGPRTIGIQGDDLPGVYLESLLQTVDDTTVETYENPMTGRTETRTKGWNNHPIYGPATIHVGTVINDRDTGAIIAVNGAEWWVAPLIEEFGGDDD